MDTLKPLEALIEAGLGQRFYQVFGFELLFTNAPDRKKVIAERLRQNPQSKTPFAFASIQTFSKSETRYSPQALLRRGLQGNATHDKVQTYNLRLIPVTSTYQITLITTDLDRLKLASKRWLFCHVERSLNFSITYGVSDIDISVDLDAELSIPPRTGGIEEAPEYEATANLRVEGFMSKDLERAQAATEVVQEGRVGDAEAIEAAIRTGDNRGTTQFFEIRRPWDNT